jgi:hypothetical protein
MTNSTNKLSGKELARQRRQALSKTGSSGQKKPTRASRRAKPNTTPVVATNNVVAQTAETISNNDVLNNTVEDNFEYCCDDCKAKGLKETCEPCSVKELEKASAEKVDEVCELIEAGVKQSTSDVRAFCKNRRRELSSIGKQALPGKAGQAARANNLKSNKSSLSGRELAKLRREERCKNGRGSAAECRPTGRSKYRSNGDAPSKVEEGTTLSGQPVTGSQVEHSTKLTGTDAGNCKVVTGTEYVGQEQFRDLCATKPEPKEPKVGVTETERGQSVSGTMVAANNRVTGSEYGASQRVTGNEYVTRYDDLKTLGATKVGVSHTAMGARVSGGELASTPKVTGDAQDLCESVTGTDYVSSERFQSVCGTRPPLTPNKVSVDSSRKGMTVTGNLMDRAANMTGNEPGTCQRVTGSQYDSSAEKGFCDQRSDKVYQTQTISGNRVSGTEVSGSPKITGDDHGSCAAVTGNDYVSKESFEQRCSHVPMAAAYKDTVSHTWNNQQISGSQISQSDIVTGDEPGTCNTITGSSYRSREEMSQYCDTAQVQDSSKAMHRAPATQPVSGQIPSVDSRLNGNFPKGSGQNISGTPYLAYSHTGATIDGDFSIHSPARQAFDNRTTRVHDSVFGTNARITGPSAKAEGVISGTPEFRSPLTPMAQSAANNQQPGRVTGEGNDSGIAVSGDNWSTGGLTGTEGQFASNRNETQKGEVIAEHNKVGAHQLRDREVTITEGPRVTNGSGGGNASAKTGASRVTLSGGARG